MGLVSGSCWGSKPPTQNGAVQAVTFRYPFLPSNIFPQCYHDGVRWFDETQFVLPLFGGFFSLVVLVKELNAVHAFVGGLAPMRMPCHYGTVMAVKSWPALQKKSLDHETPVSSINLGTVLRLAEDRSVLQNCKVVTEQKGPKNLAIGVRTFDLGRNLINAAIQGRVGVNHPVILLGIIFVSLLEMPKLSKQILRTDSVSDPPSFAHTRLLEERE